MPRMRKEMNISHQVAFDIDLNLDPLWCAWFSGWVDGEGSFIAKVGKRSGKYLDRSISCILTVMTRDDDGNLIFSGRDILKCGTVGKDVQHLGSKSYNPNRHNAIRWTCKNTGACRHILIPIFDLYPLRSKKLRDYRIWREIVISISEDQHLDGGRNHVLDLCQQLKDIRRYVPPTLIDA